MASTKRSSASLVAVSVLLSSLVTLGIVAAVLVAAGVLASPFGGAPVSILRTDEAAQSPEPVRVDRSVLQRDEAVVNAVKRASPSVVSIVVSRTQAAAVGEIVLDPFDGFFAPRTPQGGTRQIGGGSGFFVTEDGMILTNKHVVSYDDADYSVVLSNGRTLPARVLARDPSNDLALMQVEGEGFPALPLGDSAEIEIGQSVIAIGNALGEFQNTVSVGVVSGLARSVTASGSQGLVETLEGVLQTDAAINPGNSGGPLLNLAGEVVGINTAIAQGAQSIGFAIAINDAKQAIESVRTHGRIIRAFLGVRYVALTEELQRELELPIAEGALVRASGNEPAVLPGSPADTAGIRAGDVIVEVDGQRVTRERPLWRLIGGKGVGDTVRLQVVSDGQRRTVEVRLDALPE